MPSTRGLRVPTFRLAPAPSGSRLRRRGASRFTARSTLRRTACTNSEAFSSRELDADRTSLASLSPPRSHPACAWRVARFRFGRDRRRSVRREQDTQPAIRGAFDRFAPRRNPSRPHERSFLREAAPRLRHRGIRLDAASPALLRRLRPPATPRIWRGASLGHDVVERSLQRTSDVDTFARPSPSHVRYRTAASPRSSSPTTEAASSAPSLAGGTPAETAESRR